MTETVEQRAYHGDIEPSDLARSLVLRFDEGETRAHWMEGQAGRAVVQIQSRSRESGDPTTAVTAHVSPTKTGITVSVSEQKVLGVAADIAKTGLQAWLNPLRLLGEIDDIARNVRWLGLRSEVWKAVDEYCRTQGGARGAAGILSNVICPYCGTPNDIGAQNCKACRAPLTEAQPIVCGRCGFMNEPQAELCVNCSAKL
ncbi:MAG: zinc ribbon domain-containing protein [Anaerolineae bacterium]|nr:zinc ribbon domain-containing protein [Anaerolineae bacterium]